MENKKPNLGRPQKQIDEELVRKLAFIHCTMEEIGAHVGCSVDTLERRFADIIHSAKQEGKSSLRGYQWRQAQKGNINMQIWLGKQWLGQKDKQPEEATQVNFNVFPNEVPK